MSNSRAPLPPLSARTGGAGRGAATSSTPRTREVNVNKAPRSRSQQSQDPPTSRASSDTPRGKRSSSGSSQVTLPRPLPPLLASVLEGPGEKPGSAILLEPSGVAPEELASFCRLQWRVLGVKEAEKPDGPQDFEDVDMSQVEVVQGRYWKLFLNFRGLVQLRLVPNHLPDSLPAWNDWARGARKDPAWLSQCTAPTVVNLPQPPPPEVSAEVADDGASLVVLLLWTLDARLLPWLQDGPRLRWQYSWRILASSEEEGEQNWRQSGCYHCIPEEETRVRSPPLREDWDCQRVEVRVRYSLASVWSSWSFSVSCDVRLPVQESPLLRIVPSRSNFTEADATWEALVSPAKVKAWQYRIELEQDGQWRLVYAAEHANQADTLSCSLRQLVPGQSYTVRLLCRRWRIDDVWQESRQEFRMPLSGVETGVPPLRAVPEVLLAKIAPEPRADETQIWYSFWVSPISASWPPESSFVEWRPTCEPDAAWHITPSQQVALKADLEKDETFAHGGGLKVLLPTDIGQLHVRQCHVSGIVGSRTWVMPAFRPPRPPTVQLCPKDTAISLRLCAEILGEDHRHASFVQFQVSGAGEAAAASQELPLLVLDFPEGAASSEHVHLLDVEELASNVALHQKVVFQVRVGDMATKSAWSAPSAPLALCLTSPRPACQDISVKQLDRHSIEVSWPRFIAAEGLAEVDYYVKAVCCPMPEDTMQRYLPHAAAAESSENGGWCRVVLRKLVPELPHIITVTGAYPHLSRFCSQENGEAPEECQLEAHFTLAGVDPLDFPLVFPVRQVAPPQLHGGADKRFPFSLQFWLEVDQRSSLRPGSEAEYVTEWRPHTTQMDLVPPEMDDEGAWQPVVLEPAGLHAPPCGEGLTICTWDLPELPEIPELVQLRLRLLRDDTRAPGVRAWVSQISEPYATAFLPPPKPRVSVSSARHGVQIHVTFALRTSSEIDSEEAFRGEVVPGLPLAPGFGHRWARRFQVAHRLAGDRHDKDDLQEFEATDLQEAEASFDVDRPGICWYSITLPAVEPRFSEGQRVVFALRVGDDWRWSPWSVVSKPTQVRTPPLELREGSEFVVKARPPDKVEVTLPRLLEDSESVEYSVGMTPLGPKDQKVRNASQLIAFSGFTEALHEGETLEVFVGCIDPGTALRFALMARRRCHGFGAPEFKELAESDILLWPESQPRGSLVPESWELPVPKPLPVPDEFESSSGRWRGRAVLLTWPKGFAAAEELPLELQVACWDPTTCALHGRKGWCAAPWSWTEMQGLPCLVASPLPFTSCRFRWYSPDRRVAGPVSEPCLAYVDPPVEASAKIFCTMSAVRLLASFSLPAAADPAVSLCQWRFGAVRQVETDGSPSWSPVEKWQPLPRKPYPRAADNGWSFGEEDGLELGLFYMFSARLGDGIRYSAWSASSAAVLFDLPESVLPAPAPERFGLPKHLANLEMLVESLGSGSVRCWWPHVQGPVLPSIDGTTQGRPAVEYRLDVSRCLDNGGLERHATVLLEDEEVMEEIGDDGETSRAASHSPCEATVNGLQPGAEYFAALAVRFLVLGRRDWRRTGLTATFQVPRG